jgi:hypothetical protein
MSSPELNIELQRVLDELTVVEYCTPEGIH